MTVSTALYEVTHGRKPRGEGSWAFEFFMIGSDIIEFAPGFISYSAAKRWAIARAKELGCLRVAVAT